MITETKEQRECMGRRMDNNDMVWIVKGKKYGYYMGHKKV